MTSISIAEYKTNYLKPRRVKRRVLVKKVKTVSEGESTLTQHLKAYKIEFEQEFYQFSEAHPEYELTCYGRILEKNGLKWDYEVMRSADPSSLDEQGALALMMGAIRAERFCDGALLGFIEDGSLTAWLNRLKDIDWQWNKR